MREIPSTYCPCSDDDNDQESNAQADDSASSFLFSLLIQPIVTIPASLLALDSIIEGDDV